MADSKQVDGGAALASTCRNRRTRGAGGSCHWNSNDFSCVMRNQPQIREFVRGSQVDELDNGRWFVLEIFRPFSGQKAINRNFHFSEWGDREIDNIMWECIERADRCWKSNGRRCIWMKWNRWADLQLRGKMSDFFGSGFLRMMDGFPVKPSAL